MWKERYGVQVSDRPAVNKRLVKRWTSDRLCRFITVNISGVGATPFETSIQKGYNSAVWGRGIWQIGVGQAHNVRQPWVGKS